jgi:hypothetical protein
MKTTVHWIWLCIIFALPGSILGGLGTYLNQQGYPVAAILVMLAIGPVAAWTGTWAARRDNRDRGIT